MALLSLLNQIHSHVQSIHIPFRKDESTQFHDYCNGLAKFHVAETDIESQLHDYKKKPCYYCSRLRRKYILEYAQENGISKIVFAHHRDDVVETFLMNMLYQDEISTMMPKQVLFGGKFEIIRPFFMVPEYLIQKYAVEQNLPVAKNPCAFTNDTKRESVRELLKHMQKQNQSRDIREHIFKSILHINPEFMP